MANLRDLVNLELYPLDQPDSTDYLELVDACRQRIEEHGMYELDGFVRPEAIESTVAAIEPRMATESFTHRRRHNIYFLPMIDGVAPDHPALTEVETVNHTLCADQLLDTALHPIYEWGPLRAFIAATVGIPELHLMDDPLSRVNVMSYRAGEALNWHFDRSEFTTTILLQAPIEGGVFEYRSDLRSECDPNLDGVAELIAGRDGAVRTCDIRPGGLNVFRGKNTAHRVTPVVGDHQRLVAVFSYYEHPGVRQSAADQLGFYGRSA